MVIALQDERLLEVLGLMERRRLLPREGWDLCRTMAMSFRPTARLTITDSNILAARNAYAHKNITEVMLRDCLDHPLGFLEGARLTKLVIAEHPFRNLKRIGFALGTIHVRDLAFIDSIPDIAAGEFRAAQVHTMIVDGCWAELQLPATVKHLRVAQCEFSGTSHLSEGWQTLQSIILRDTTIDLMADFSKCKVLRSLKLIDVSVPHNDAILWPDSLEFLEIGYTINEHVVDLYFPPLPDGLQTLHLHSLLRWPFGHLPQGLKQVTIASADCQITSDVLPEGLHTLTLKDTAGYKVYDANPFVAYPAGLKVLRFECENFPYSIGALPPGLEELVLPAEYVQEIGVLPSSLKSVKMPMSYRFPIRTSGPIVIYTHND